MSELSDRLRELADLNDCARHLYDDVDTIDELRQAADELDRLEAMWRAACAGQETLAAEVGRLRAIIDPLNRLREAEGNAVTFICPNPDFNGQPDEAIEVSAEWTKWETRRFTGDTLADCLQAAEKARKA